MNGKSWLGFYGAAGNVTGSRTLIHARRGGVLVDCGLFQGTQVEREQNWQPFPFDATALEGIVLTHAHIDHSGAIPLAYKRGYRGPVFCTPGTAELLEILLRDTGRLQEEEAHHRNWHGWSKHRPALALFTEEEAAAALSLVRIVDYQVPFHLGGMEFAFHRAAHIVGSAHAHCRLPSGPTVLFSGDVGRGDHLLLGDVPPRPVADLIVCESTYGDRLHPALPSIDELQAALEPVLARRGIALMPSFAVGRAQDVIAMIAELFDAKRLPVCPVYLDSPMAAKALDITAHDERELRPEGPELLRRARHYAKITGTQDDSKRLNALRGPAVIVSASGMLTGGRILHHIVEHAGRPENALILCGYQARGTRGRRIVDGEREIKIFGQPVPLRLEVKCLTTFSAHADREGLVRWLLNGPPPERVYLNHGEPGAALALKGALEKILPRDVRIAVARGGERVDLNFLQDE
jgi:metallo-beta-lactamase family protein